MTKDVRIVALCLGTPTHTLRTVFPFTIAPLGLPCSARGSVPASLAIVKPSHPTIEALQEYARLDLTIDGEIQCHLDSCPTCEVVYETERCKAAERREHGEALE